MGKKAPEAPAAGTEEAAPETTATPTEETKEETQADTKAEAKSDEKPAKADKKATMATVVFAKTGYKRTYTLEVHGAEFQDLAKQKAEKLGEGAQVIVK